MLPAPRPTTLNAARRKKNKKKRILKDLRVKLTENFLFNKSKLVSTFATSSEKFFRLLLNNFGKVYRKSNFPVMQAAT